MFADHVHRPPVGKPRRDRPPACAVILARVGVRRVVVVAVAVERHVHPAVHRVRCLDAAHVGARRHPRHVVDHVRPRCAAVPRYLQVPVVRAHIEGVGGVLRLREGRDVAVGGDAVVSRQRLVRHHPAHDLERVAVDRLRQVGARLLPVHPAVPRPEEVVPAQVDRRPVVVGDRERRVPVEAVAARLLVLRLVPGRARHGPDRLPFARGHVDARHVPSLRLGEHDVRIVRVGVVVEAVPEPHVRPLAVAHAPGGLRAVRRAPVAVVLQPAADVVGVAHVHVDLVELADRHVADRAPRHRAVAREGEPAVVAVDEVIGVVRVDPQRVVVRVDLVRRVPRPPCAAAIVRGRGLDAAEIDALRVVGVDPNEGEVHGTRVAVAHHLPRLAAVGGAVHALTLARLDDRVHEIAVTPVDVESDAPELALRQPLGEARPAFAAVRGAPDARAAAPGREAEPRPLPLVRGREQRVGVVVVHDEVDDARVLVDVEDLLPRRAAVRRLEQPPLLVRAPQVADRADVGDIGVARIDLDSADVARVLEADVRPRPPRVRGPEHADAPRRTLAVRRLARPHPHHVGVRGGHAYRPDRGGGLIVEHRIPRHPVVRRLPHAPGPEPDVEDAGVALDDGEVRHPPAHDRGSQLPKIEPGGGRRRPLGGGLGDEGGGKRRQRPERESENGDEGRRQAAGGAGGTQEHRLERHRNLRR